MINVFGYILLGIFCVFAVLDIFTKGNVRVWMVKKPKRSSWLFATFILVGVLSQLDNITNSKYSVINSSLTLIIVISILYFATRSYILMGLKKEGKINNSEMNVYNKFIYNTLFVFLTTTGAVMWILHLDGEENALYLVLTFLFPILDGIIDKSSIYKD